MKRLPIIALSGKIASGKDTVASMLTSIFEEEGYELETKRFATHLKRFVANIIGVPIKKLDDQDFKKSYLGPEWNYLVDKYGAEILTDLGENRHWSKKQMTVREILIRIGDGMRKVVHEDIWVNALFSEYREQPVSEYKTCGRGIVRVTPERLQLPNWIIPDMRYRNEKERTEKLGGVTIRINRKDCQYIDHISETGLDNEQFTYVINNNGSLQDLFEQVKAIAHDIRDTKRVY